MFPDTTWTHAVAASALLSAGFTLKPFNMPNGQSVIEVLSENSTDLDAQFVFNNAGECVSAAYFTERGDGIEGSVAMVLAELANILSYIAEENEPTIEDIFDEIDHDLYITGKLED